MTLNPFVYLGLCQRSYPYIRTPVHISAILLTCIYTCTPMAEIFLCRIWLYTSLLVAYENIYHFSNDWFSLLFLDETLPDSPALWSICLGSAWKVFVHKIMPQPRRASSLKFRLSLCTGDALFFIFVSCAYLVSISISESAIALYVGMAWAVGRKVTKEGYVELHTDKSFYKPTSKASVPSANKWASKFSFSFLLHNSSSSPAVTKKVNELHM